MKIIDTLIKAYCTCFGVGLIPFAPGTFGSLVGLVPFLVFGYNVKIVSGVSVFLLVTGTYATEKYSQIVGDKDPKSAVIDEILGICVAFLVYSWHLKGSNNGDTKLMGFFNKVLPTSNYINLNAMWAYHVMFCLIIFAFFRLFDILKPFPVSHFDRNVGGGFGIMMDDLVAGIMAGLLTRITLLTLCLI